MPFKTTVVLIATAAVLSIGVDAQRSVPAGAASAIEAASLKEWLGYIASDELQGREVYTEGLGLAASYIARHLKEWGVRPGGDDGGYFQTVKVLGVRNTGKSSITVDVKGKRQTFLEGDAIELSANVGAKRVFTADDVLFLGYGAEIRSAGIDDYKDLDLEGKVVVWLGPQGPREAGDDSYRLFAARTREAIEKGAAAVIHPPYSASARGAKPPADQDQPEAIDPSDGAQPRSGRRERNAAPAADFTIAGRLDEPVPPSVTAYDEFFEFLFGAAEMPYSRLQELAADRAPLPHFTLKGVTLTFNIAPEYAVVNTRLTRNVVGIVEGTDPKLKDTYVTFGAHYDHIGYESSGRASTFSNFGCPGQTRPEPPPGDIINNGADDDGTGTVALMAIARAFARGLRPRRSLAFIWHTAEESGLLGSRYNADYPVVPNEKVLAQLNVDMIGRNRCDDASEENTVYLVGSDRISTDLHNFSEDANASLPRPMTLDYELNDPADPQSLYTRSDHYSYAEKGIPVIFYTTGLHRDYHFVTDEVDKIEWNKLTRVTQLILATGQRLANLEHAPARDNRGPRVGRERGGKIK